VRPRLLATHDELLDASGGSAFVRFDIPAPLPWPGFALDGAIALPRKTHTRRLGLLVMGATANVGALLSALLEEALLPADLAHVTVTRGSVEAVGSHLPLGDGSEWEWMYAASPPERVPAESSLVPLSHSDIGEITALLAEANPDTDARPFESPDQHWVGARDDQGRLVACGVREPNVAGWPILSGITVHSSARRTGLGLAVTAYLTRAAVEAVGICTLGMYSHNDVARRVYHGLGYTGDHLWSSRRLANRPGPVASSSGPVAPGGTPP
jgi:ribosomal protein S18 acetylase RimI-like enzyme